VRILEGAVAEEEARERFCGVFSDPPVPQLRRVLRPREGYVHRFDLNVMLTYMT